LWKRTNAEKSPFSLSYLGAFKENCAKAAVNKAKEQRNGMLKAVAYPATHAATDSMLRSRFISDGGVLRYVHENLR